MTHEYLKRSWRALCVDERGGLSIQHMVAAVTLVVVAGAVGKAVTQEAKQGGAGVGSTLLAALGGADSTPDDRQGSHQGGVESDHASLGLPEMNDVGSGPRRENEVPRAEVVVRNGREFLVTPTGEIPLDPVSDTEGSVDEALAEMADRAGTTVESVRYNNQGQLHADQRHWQRQVNREAPWETPIPMMNALVTQGVDDAGGHDGGFSLEYAPEGPPHYQLVPNTPEQAAKARECAAQGSCADNSLVLDLPVGGSYRADIASRIDPDSGAIRVEASDIGNYLQRIHGGDDDLYRGRELAFTFRDEPFRRARIDIVDIEAYVR